MDEVYFLARYTPFWAMPLFLLSGEFAYVSWVRRKKKWLSFCLVLAALSAGSLVFYYWAGGPERSVRILMEIVRFYST